MKRMLTALLAAIFCAALLGFSQSRASASSNSAAVQAIRDTDARWLAAVKERNAAKVASFWSDDAVIFAPNTSGVRGKQAILEYVTGAFASPEFSITWTADEYVVSRSGDMAYETGKDVITYKGADGRVVTEHNNGVVVWKKQADGSWKAAVDIWNSSEPLPTTLPAK
jgi:uncharacterized protein (TIGR02246 family)